MKKIHILISLLLISVLFLAGCQVLDGDAKPVSQALLHSTVTQGVNDALMDKTSEVLPSATPTIDSTNSPFVLQEVVGCQDEFCQWQWPGFLERPIGESDQNTIDLTYPYASTRNGTLDPHHGVEFYNPHGTQVLAAGSGEVVFAGSDDVTVLGPFNGFYGNVIVIHHPRLFAGRDLFTLYAHLSAIEVERGDSVTAGEVIGEVGASGVADGSHLHFEVQLGFNDYNHTINPILWFAPILKHEDGAGGILAGLLIDKDGNPLSEQELSLERFAPDGSVEKHYYFKTYTLTGINSHPELGENFVLPDLPPGEYRLAYVNGKLYEVHFTLQPDSLGFVKLQIH